LNINEYQLNIKQKNKRNQTNGTKQKPPPTP